MRIASRYWVVLLVLGANLVASPLQAEEAKSAHREVPPPESAEQAWRMIAEDLATLQRYLEKPQLSGVDLYEIHMLTYSTRIAIERLQRDWTAIGELGEALHEASEKGDEAQTRAHAQALMQAIEAVKRSAAR